MMSIFNGGKRRRKNSTIHTGQPLGAPSCTPSVFYAATTECISRPDFANACNWRLPFELLLASIVVFAKVPFGNFSS